jgi:nucleotide-binding universal stress UspA family protein
MKLIIATTDFSAISNNAIKYATDMATAMGTSLMLVNVYQLPISFSEVPLVTISLDEIRDISEQKLAEMKKNLESITDGKLKIYTESRLGEVGEEITKLTETLSPFAIIMGTRGTTGAGRFFMGSNSISVISKVGVPVFVIPPGVRFKPFKKIGLATDLKAVVDNTPISKIREVVQFFHAELHVLNVDYHRKHFTPSTPEETLNMDSLLAGMNPLYDFIENKDIDQGLNDFSEKNNLDLLITLPKKHSMLERFFEKSTTRELIHETHIPIMCIHRKFEEPELTKTQHFSEYEERQ